MPRRAGPRRKKTKKDMGSIIHTKRPRPKVDTVRDSYREAIGEVPGPKAKPPGKPARMAKAYRTGFRELKRGTIPKCPPAHLSFEEKVQMFDQCPVEVSPTLMDVFQMVGDRDAEHLDKVKKALKKLAVGGE